MELAVNYSIQTAELLRQQQIAFERFKCSDHLFAQITTIQESHPIYLHFPLKVGLGISDAMNTHTNQPARWDQVEGLMEQTDTPFINLHLTPEDTDYPEVSTNTTDPMHVEMLRDNMIRDVSAVVRRFGAERVIVENDFDGRTHNVLRPAFLSEVICQIVAETGCGLLLDVSHARLAADYLGIDPYEYITDLPVQYIQELHITGIHRIEGIYIEMARQMGVDEALIQHVEGRLVDHMPMGHDDWSFLAWVIDQINNDSWGRPWIVTFEYGGVGDVWEQMTRTEILVEQVPRLYSMLNNK